MNSQELRALQEAYSQVYELDEVSQKTATRAFAARATNEFESDGADYNYTKGGKSKADETKRRIEKKHGKAAGQHAERAAHAKIFGRKKTALTSMPPKPTNSSGVTFHPPSDKYWGIGRKKAALPALRPIHSADAA